jgi:NADH:ubiquinone oxidoreductase subunit 6 (subunit J)
MIVYSVIMLITFFARIQTFIYSIDPSFLDIVKIFAGSIGWIGGLTLFMWRREKQKNPSFQLIERSKTN